MKCTLPHPAEHLARKTITGDHQIKHATNSDLQWATFNASPHSTEQLKKEAIEASAHQSIIHAGSIQCLAQPFTASEDQKLAGIVQNKFLIVAYLFIECRDPSSTIPAEAYFLCTVRLLRCTAPLEVHSRTQTSAEQSLWSQEKDSCGCRENQTVNTKKNKKTENREDHNSV